MKEWQQVHRADVLHLQMWQEKLRLQSAFETCPFFRYDAAKEKVSAQLPTGTFLWFLHGAAKENKWHLLPFLLHKSTCCCQHPDGLF